MKRKLFFALGLVLFIACEKKITPEPDPINPNVFILNEGAMGKNNAKLSVYNTDTEEVTHEFFYTQNGKGLGDTANDMVIYGSKAYIAVNGSKIIFVTDLEGKILGEIKKSNEKGELAPRQLAAAGGNVYVSFYEGYLGEIDTTSFETRITEAGAAPEAVVVEGNMAYVANSTAYLAPLTNTVSVIDLSTFQLAKTIEVGSNPLNMISDGKGSIYVTSRGDYASIPPALDKINIQTGISTKIDGITPDKISLGSEYLYIMSTSYDANWNATITFSKMNLLNNEVSDLITDDTEVKEGYSISISPLNEDIYIGTSDYKLPGNIYVYSKDGKFKTKFASGGINPNGVFFITE